MKDDKVTVLIANGTIDGKFWGIRIAEESIEFTVSTDKGAPPMFCEFVPLSEPVQVADVGCVIAHAKSRYYASVGKGKYA